MVLSHYRRPTDRTVGLAEHTDPRLAGPPDSRPVALTHDARPRIALRVIDRVRVVDFADADHTGMSGRISHATQCAPCLALSIDSGAAAARVIEAVDAHDRPIGPEGGLLSVLIDDDGRDPIIPGSGQSGSVLPDVDERPAKEKVLVQPRHQTAGHLEGAQSVVADGDLTEGGVVLPLGQHLRAPLVVRVFVDGDRHCPELLIMWAVQRPVWIVGELIRTLRSAVFRRAHRWR